MGKHLDAVGNASSTFQPLRKEQWHWVSLVSISSEQVINQQQLHAPSCMPGTTRSRSGTHRPAPRWNSCWLSGLQLSVARFSKLKKKKHRASS